ncbi:hypothetical protein DPMN_000336 [Dreissena polymorpha]|uniref:Uncharacterized protein n=1 Tax=Dreissena polymorpha TaxID=45954 RepID=A0A9D4MJJ2_DREPO|nr:hypothetical protein DPMN_000336 [Dreissena polymorpha]
MFQAKITCAHCIATAPAPHVALTSSISVPAEPNLWYFQRQYNKKLPYRSCNRRILPTEVQARSAGARCTGTISTICDCSRPDLALTSSISVPAEPYLPYST